MMKKIYLAIVLFTGIFTSVNAQTYEEVHTAVMGFIKAGDYTNAKIAVTNALAKNPDNYELQKEEVTVAYLIKDWGSVMDLGKKLIKHKDADAAAFQMLGTTYNNLAQTKDAKKTYQEGIAKFPASGALLNEYGEMLAANKEKKEAIKQWELSIEKDANYSVSYYNAAKYYGENNNLIWAVYYGENFINLESYSKRTIDMQSLLLDWYKKIYSQPNIALVYGSSNQFANMIAATLAKQNAAAGLGITPETLTTIRAGFVKDWFNPDNAKYFASRLFDHWQQLTQLDHFKAYNIWVFGAAFNTAVATKWKQDNKDAYSRYETFQKSKIFKIPAGQYYQK